MTDPRQSTPARRLLGEGRPVPTSTYRVQLGADHTFDDVAAEVSYLASLGVTHVYLSPILRAAPGSTHGYDVVDHDEVAPLLGGLAGLRRLATAAHAAGLGLVLDI
ncbi:MAG: malto-oligosyltrehalose synthase, partial [Cellulomonadaceae bacterium]|nr:malto-oligosyltrehalose synthase [Cellulomonadaceae bacterium]